MANNLIIGLGGTGGKVLREFRKRVYEEFHSNEPSNNVNLEYIYVDSSDDDLNSHSGWKVMGKSVHLQPAQKVSIHGINASMFNNLSMYPGISCFLNKDDVNLMTSKLGPLITAGIGGQRRRLGRVLLANNLSVSDANSDFVSRVKQTVQRLQNKSNNQQITFHICAGLAGGTGSGSIVDVISQIRKNFPPQPDNDPYKIFLYLYIPEMNVVTASHDAGFYQANGYAALLELNAMSIGKYEPYDTTGQKDNFSGEVQRLLNGVNPFEGAYLYSNVNESGKILDISSELPAAVADFIFHKVVTSSMVGDSSKLGRLEGCENNGAGPESDKSGTPTRSRKFLAFGIKRVEYPENEIEQYVTYNFARQAARQLEFNLWQDGIGYAECSMDEVGHGFVAEIKDKRNRERLLLSNSYLMLSKPIIETAATKKWHDIDGTWEQRTQGFADDAQNGADKKSWLAVFTDNCEDYYTQHFRGLGVVKFYSAQHQETSGYAKTIRRHIEQILFDEWNSGQKSILEVEKYTKLLIDDCTERIEQFKEHIAKQEEELDNANGNIRKINSDWDNIGWLRDAITGASKKVFSAYKTAKYDYYTTATRIEAYRYASDLLQKVIEQLGIMLDGIIAYKGMLTTILDEVGNQADSRCQKVSADATDITIKMYDIDMVHNFTKKCIVNQEMQNTNSLSIRNHLASMLGEDGEHSFANLFEKTDHDTTIDLILDDCQKNAEAAMINTAKDDPLNKMVGVNILEKLKQDYNSDEKLEKFVQKCVNEAKAYLQFNSEEQGKVFNTDSGGMMKMIQLSLPRFDDDKSGFRDKLINSFVQAYPGFNPKEDVSVNYKNNQLVIVAAISGFPLRYVTNVKVIKKKYEDKLSEPDAELNKMVLHTETFDKMLPSLFEIDSSELRESLKKPVILAFAMGIIQPQEDPTTGEHFYAVGIPDEFGDIELHKAGKTLISTIDELADDYAVSKQLTDIVDKKLKTECRSNSQKIEMKESVKKVLKENILASKECENNQFNPLYTKYKNICRDIFTNELKEL